MATAPTALFRKEDFPDLQSAGNLDRFFRQLNSYFTQNTAALTRGLTVAANMLGQFKEVTFRATSTSDVPQGTSFAYNLPGGAKPVAVAIVKATQLSDSGGVETQVAVFGPGWTESDGKVVLSDVGGLSPSVNYRVLFLVLGG